MITEIADIAIHEGMQDVFERGVQQARALFLRAAGCHGVTLHRCIEQPRRYRLMVLWENVEFHTVLFRGSDDFRLWRDLVSSCFEAPPVVEHFEQVL